MPGIPRATSGLISLGVLITMLAVLGLPATTGAQALVSQAAVLAGKMATAGQTITSVVDLTGQTDPDGLLGLNGEYVAKAQFADTAGVTGYVEVFNNARDANARRATLAANNGGETDIVNGAVVLRVMQPSADATAYATAVGAALAGH
ncbi:MAG: hypothetical protein JOY61_09245 [Chloroflexi bacterium]|nr:hypothetical protein [Chloroflexota bacterium]